MEEAPQVVEYYRNTIAPDPEVDMIFVSLDNNAAGLSRWRSAHSPPYAILSLEATQNKDRIPTLGKHVHLVSKVNRMMPAYLIVDAEGNTVVEPEAHWNLVKNFLEKKAEKG